MKAQLVQVRLQATKTNRKMKYNPILELYQEIERGSGPYQKKEEAHISSIPLKQIFCNYSRTWRKTCFYPRLNLIYMHT